MRDDKDQEINVEDPAGIAMIMQYGDESKAKKEDASHQSEEGKEPRRTAGRREGGEEQAEGEHKAAGDGGEDKRMQEKRDQERSDTVEESIIYWQDKDEIPESLETTKNTLKEVVGLGSSFDIVFREMTLAGQNTGLFSLTALPKTTSCWKY